MSVHIRTRPSIRSLAAAALAVAASACQDALTAPRTPTPAVADVAHAQALTCAVDVRAHTLACASAEPTARTSAQGAGGPRRTLAFGGQGLYVRLNATATAPPSHDSLAVPVTVQNLLAQPLGTTDGLTYDGHGVMVFFAQAPTATAGSGTVTVLNPDTTGTFTAAGQQGFVYRQLLTGNQTTPVHTWLFSVPSSVAAFQFVVYVRAQLADEASPMAEQPAHTFAANGDAGIVGGASHTCALRPGAGVYCWGTTAVAATAGAMQDSTSPVPLLVPGSAGAIALAPSAGAAHACWLTGAGAAACVGDNQYGQLGTGTFATPAQTVRAVQMPNGVTSFGRLTVGAQHTCALTGAGAAYCWGGNFAGQLGTGTNDDASTPAAVRMPAGVQFAQIGAGYLHSCGLTAAGAAYCWGSNLAGQLGDGTTADTTRPSAVRLPAGVALTRVAGGGLFTCGLAAGGSAYCWGDNTLGQLGDGTTTPHLTPARVQVPSGVTLTRLAVGFNHACASAAGGSVYCWGDNTSGQLGDGTYVAHASPTAVILSGLAAGEVVTQLSAGGDHSCALANSGAAYCWGSNAHDQIGDGIRAAARADRGTPATVRMP